MMITFYMKYILILIILNLLLQYLHVNGQVCNIGEYSADGSSPCTSCFTGYTTSSTGSTDYSDCDVCNTGRYGTSITTAMSGGCSVPWSEISTSGTSLILSRALASSLFLSLSFYIYFSCCLYVYVLF